MAIGKVAREALILMHFEKVDEAIAAGDAKLLVDRDGGGLRPRVLRCLLSYYNQPDHELIDRTSDEAKQMLIDLARGQVVLAGATRRRKRRRMGGRLQERRDSAARCLHGVSFSGQEMSFVWRSHFVARLRRASEPTRRARRRTPKAGRCSSCRRRLPRACLTR